MGTAVGCCILSGTRDPTLSVGSKPTGVRFTWPSTGAAFSRQLGWLGFTMGWRWAWICLLVLTPCRQVSAAGFLVLAGQPRPVLARLDIRSGPGVRLDLILPSQPVAGVDCRYSLFGLGGTVVAPLAVKVVRLGPIAAVDGSVRIPVDLEIPVAAPGARFLVRAEKMVDSRREVLAEIELRVVDEAPLAELRAAVAAGRIQIIGESKRLREFLAARQMAVGSEPAASGLGVVALTEDRPDEGPPLSESVAVLVVCQDAADAMLTVLAKPSGAKWVVQAGLPHFRQLAEAPEAERELAQVFHFADQLTPNPSNVTPPP